MKKILHVITGLNTGGAEMMLYKILSSTKAFNYIVICLSVDKNTVIAKKITDLGITIYYLDLSLNLHLLTVVQRIQKILKNECPDVIQGWMYHGNLAAIFCSFVSKTRTPVIWNVRRSLHDLKTEKLATRLIIKLNSFLSFLPSKIIFNSQISAVQHEAIGFIKQKTLLIPNGFDLSEFAPNMNNRIRIRRELGINEDEVLIGLVGRYHPIKGHSNFLKAASLLSSQLDNIKFVLVGKNVDHDNEMLTSEIRDLGLYEKIILLGSRDDIPALTNAFDIATSASSGEAFSNTLGEAMATGIPCVATDVGDSRLLLNSIGVIVEPGSPLSLSEGWNHLISAGKEGRAKLGILAREHIQQHYSLNSVSSLYTALYNEVS